MSDLKKIFISPDEECGEKINKGCDVDVKKLKMSKLLHPKDRFTIFQVCLSVLVVLSFQSSKMPCIRFKFKYSN